MIEEVIIDVVKKTSGVKLNTLIIMSNHVHLILQFSTSALPLGEIIRRCKAKITRAFGKPGLYIWQPNYYEHIIRSEEALEQIQQYIKLNPEFEIEKFDRFYTPSSR